MNNLLQYYNNKCVHIRESVVIKMNTVINQIISLIPVYY